MGDVYVAGSYHAWLVKTSSVQCNDKGAWEDFIL